MGDTISILIIQTFLTSRPVARERMKFKNFCVSQRGDLHPPQRKLSRARTAMCLLILIGAFWSTPMFAMGKQKVWVDLAWRNVIGCSVKVQLATGVRDAIWAVIWGGGAKRMGGGKRTRERALPKIFGPLQESFWSTLSWIFVQEKQSTDTRGGWKTYRTRGGGSKTPFGEGCHS